MRCKKCGKVMRKDELFCDACGYYNGKKDSSGWDESTEEESTFDDFDNLTEDTTEADNFEEFDLKNDSSSTQDNKFYYENEDLLEAFIGEDYKSIKKIPFNLFAFLLNWSYLLYRKLYITGILGLIVTGIIIIYFKDIFITYCIVVTVALGILFNFYYVFVCKLKVERIKKKYEDTDKFGLMNICEEKGGVNLLAALIIYFIFLVIIFFSQVSITFNRNHNPKFWQENSDNRATCSSLVKTGYQNLDVYKVPGKVEEAVCKISKANFTEYDVYIKTVKGNKTYYAYYYADDKGMMYKRNTSEISMLEIKKANGQITEEEQSLLNSLKQIENNYSDITKQSKVEDELIRTKKNKSEKVNFVFTKEEVIR